MNVIAEEWEVVDRETRVRSQLHPYSFRTRLKALTARLLECEPELWDVAPLQFAAMQRSYF